MSTRGLRRQTEADAQADELRKVKAVKEKLETLCKELQKRASAAMEHAAAVSAEDDKRRKELSAQVSCPAKTNI